MNPIRNTQKRIKSESQKLFNLNSLDKNRHLFQDPTMRTIVHRY